MQATALVRPAVRRAHRSGAVSHATTFRNAETRAELVLVTPGTLALPKVARLQAQGARIFVVGDNPVAMSLAELALPGATPLWINLRQSAEIGRLHRDIQALGLPDLPPSTLSRSCGSSWHFFPTCARTARVTSPCCPAARLLPQHW
jgi:hypothetical protein